MAPPQPSFTTPETKKTSPTAAARAVAPPKTAQDLLLGITRPSLPQSHSQHMRVASSPGLTTPLLFGGSTSSIWAPTPDTDPFNYPIGASRSNIALNGGAIHNSPPAPLQSLQSAARSPPSISQVAAWNGGAVNTTSPTQRSQPQQSTQLQQQQQSSQFLGHSSSAVGFIPPQVQGKFGPGHLRGVSESLVGSRKVYQPSSPPHPPSQSIQQIQQFQQQQQQQNAVGMNRRVDAWPPATVQEQVGGFGGNGLGPIGAIGGGLPHSQAQPTGGGMQSFSDTIYAASPNANTGFYQHHSQPSQSASQGQLLSQGSQPMSQQQLQILQAQLQQQQQQQQLGSQHAMHSGHGLNFVSPTTNGRAAQFGGSSAFGGPRGFATAPYLSSSSIWGNPG